MERKIVPWLWLILLGSAGLCSCLGLGLKQSTAKVVGGQNASSGEFPFLVSIQWNFGNGTRAVHFCGGTIVDRYWILTAAHCRETVFEDGWLEVVAGEFDLQHDEGYEQRRNVSEFLVHEDRQPGFVGPYDIALIKLEQPFKLNDYVTTVKLDERNTPIYGTAVLPGWGSTSPFIEPIYPDKLQKAYLPVFPYDACLQYFPLFSPLEKTNFCAGELNGSVNACHRDSGGPLLQTFDETVIQIGIVSWGALPCTAYRSPTVVTWISCFKEWVRITIEKHTAGSDS